MNIAEYVPVKGTETWEVVTPGTIWVWVMDGRSGKYRKDKFGGREGSKIMRLSIDDRRYNEEQVVDENAHLNPFRNGFLRYVSTAGAPRGYVTDVDTTYHLTDDQVAEYLAVKDGDAFRASMENITSEFVIRRIAELGGKSVTVEQGEILSDIITSRYSNSKTQKDLRDDPEFQD